MTQKASIINAEKPIRFRMRGERERLSKSFIHVGYKNTYKSLLSLPILVKIA